MHFQKTSPQGTLSAASTWITEGSRETGRFYSCSHRTCAWFTSTVIWTRLIFYSGGTQISISGLKTKVYGSAFAAKTLLTFVIQTISQQALIVWRLANKQNFVLHKNYVQGHNIILQGATSAPCVLMQFMGCAFIRKVVLSRDPQGGCEWSFSSTVIYHFKALVFPSWLPCSLWPKIAKCN